MLLSTKSSIWLTVTGVIFIIAGIAVLAYPGLTLESLAVLLGISILITGIAQLAAFIGNTQEERGWVLFAGIADVIIGLFLLLNITPTALALPFIIGFWAMFTSLSKVAAAFSLKKRGFKNWGILLAAGIIGFVIACLIIYYPVFGALFITAYVSVFLLFAGAMSIAEAVFIKRILK